MAAYTTRHEVETIHRTVIELPARTNWVEVDKALAACRSLAGVNAADDAVTVTADEECIRFVITDRAITTEGN